MSSLLGRVGTGLGQFVTGDWGNWFSKAFGGHPGGSSNMASGLRAQIAREQWDDYKTRFQPLENVLLGFANNKDKYINDQVGQAQGLVNNQYAGAPDQINRRLTSYGLTTTPDQQQNIDRQLANQKSLALVQGSNIARRTADDQITEIMGGGLFSANRAAINNKTAGPSSEGG